jgi:hypothetical protein
LGDERTCDCGAVVIRGRQKPHGWCLQFLDALAFALQLALHEPGADREAGRGGIQIGRQRKVTIPISSGVFGTFIRSQLPVF